MTRMRIAIVGAGVHGLATAWRLAARGHDVTVFEQFLTGHDRGSSHGASRIVRKAYPDRFYSEHMLRAYPMWAELERASGEAIINECGLLYYGGEDAPNIVSLIEGLGELRVPHQLLDAAAAAKVLPGLKLASDEVGVFTREAGWVAADRALDAMWRLARGNGARLRQQRIQDLAALARGFDRVCVCAGAWLPKLFGVSARVTLQTFAYAERRMAGPVWIEDSEDNLYGFPSEPGDSRIKIGVHAMDNEADPDDPDREPDPAHLDKIRALCHRRFGEASVRLSGQKGCLYTSTPTEDFLFGRIGEAGFYASPCSGHGFKFGPYIGALMADFAEGKDSPENHPRFLGPPGTLG